MTPMSSEFTYRYLVDADEAREMLDSIREEKIIGLDTETYWDAGTGQSRVSLVQIASRSRDVIVVDAIAVDIELVRPLVDSPDVIVVAHNARFDEGMLEIEGMKPAGFVDTLRLARNALTLPSYSLASVSSSLFGLELDKSYQRSNWRYRPLSRAQIHYAAMDAYLALRLYDELTRMLDAEGRLADALSRAKLLSRAEQNAARRKRRVPTVPDRELTVDELIMLESLKEWRQQKSLRLHWPVYMICSDRTLQHLVMARPCTITAMEEIYGLGPSRLERFGQELLRLLVESTSEPG
jgi:ribonuclease D